MDVALSKRGGRLLRSFFALVVVFLYAPIVILLIFSFNDSALPSFPLSGFTLHWYHQFLVNADLRAALRTSALSAAATRVGAVFLGVLASVALVRRAFRAKPLVSALLLSPLVIPYLVFGIARPPAGHDCHVVEPGGSAARLADADLDFSHIGLASRNPVVRGFCGDRDAVGMGLAHAGRRDLSEPGPRYVVVCGGGNAALCAAIADLVRSGIAACSLVTAASNSSSPA